MRDAFDSALNSLISIWRKGGSGVFDTYGIESQTYTLLLENVKCAFDPGPGKEIVTQAGFGVQKYTFFLRPIQVDFPPVPLNIHHWIQVNVANSVPVVLVSATALMFDIKNIKNMRGHHLEVEAELVEP